MFLLRNALALMVTAGLGVGTLVGTNAEVQSKVRLRTQEAAQVATHLASQVRAELHVGSPAATEEPLQTRTEERERNQLQVGADEAPGNQLETQTQTRTEDRSRNQTGEQVGEPQGPQHDGPGFGNSRNGP